MNINFNLISYASIPTLFKESILSSLTPQQKKVAAIAAIAFVCLAAYYVIFKNCLFKATDLSDQKKPFDDTSSDPINIQQEEVKKEEAKNEDCLHESPIIKKDDKTILKNKALKEEKIANEQPEEQITSEEDPSAKSSILDEANDIEKEKISEDEIIPPLDQKLTPEHWIMKPAELVQVIYGTDGPRGNWVFDGKETYRKIIHAGSAWLAIKMQLFQSFCKQVGLAEPTSFSQEEFEGFYKSYIILELTEQEWKEHIEPIQTFCRACKSSGDLEAWIEMKKEEVIDLEKINSPFYLHEQMALSIYDQAIRSLQANLIPTQT